MKKVIVLFVLMLFLAACLPIPKVEIKQDIAEEKEEVTEIEDADVEAAETEEVEDNGPVKTVTEGELVSFPNLKVTDPDGDKITLTFSQPLNENGEWQTEVGDAGEYVITITASDGSDEVNQKVKIIVKAKNTAPVISIADSIEIKEGEKVILSPVIEDPDGDEFEVTYSGFMTTTEYTATFEDAGSHKVKITATDGTNIAEKEIFIVIHNVNRAPVIDPIEDITIKEGDKVIVTPTGIDPDGDQVKYSFSAPLDEAGKWKTIIGDDGTYEITVSARDDKDKTDTKFTIIVEAVNKAPVIEIEDITILETETVTLSPEITDVDGDEFSVSYSGWMTSNTKTTDYDDAGTHIVTLTAKDSAGNEAKKDVTITVENKNRVPVFE